MDLLVGGTIRRIVLHLFYVLCVALCPQAIPPVCAFFDLTADAFPLGFVGGEGGLQRLQSKSLRRVKRMGTTVLHHI